MQVLQAFKPGRLVLAIVATVVIADVAPDANLSTGLLESSWNQLAESIQTEDAVQTAIARPAQ